MSRSRAYCFTSNNFTSATEEAWRECGSKYLVYGREVGESGTPHLQGYVEFSTVKSLAQLKAIDGRAHFEVRRGTAKQAADYCKKDGNFEEIGTISKSRDEVTKDNASKWAGYLSAAQEGRFEDIPAEVRVRYHKALGCIRTECINQPDMDVELDNYWICGPSGSGKSLWAHGTFPGFYKKSKSEWWDRYDGEDTVLIEDVGPGDLKASWLKEWADRYAFTAPYKGGMFKAIRPRRIVVTSNYQFEELFGPREWQPLNRRFKVLEINNLGALPVGEFKIREELNIVREV